MSEANFTQEVQGFIREALAQLEAAQTRISSGDHDADVRFLIAEDAIEQAIAELRRAVLQW